MSLEKMKQSELFNEGLEIRRSVLGAEYVDRSLETMDPFMEPMQQLTTEWCWGTLWKRPGIDRRTRSIVNLALLTALNRPHELRIHVAGALRNGVTAEEIQEVFLQCGVYAGIPAALESFKIGQEVVRAQAAASKESVAVHGAAPPPAFNE